MAEVISLPVVPLRGMTIFPNMIVHLDIGRDRSVSAVEAAMVEDRKVFLIAQKTLDNESPTRDDLYKVGTVSEIKQILKLPDGNIRVLVEGMNRAVMVGYREFESYAEVDVEVHEDKWTNSLNIEALIRGVVHEFEDWVKLSRKIPPETFVAVTILEDVGRLADLIASHLNLKLEDKQAILECIDVEQRLQKLYEILARELEVLQMENKIGQRVRTQMEKFQKDYYLREQLKAIHKELGEDEDRSEEVSEYQKRLQEENYPDEVKKIVEKELSRMEKLPSMSQELSVIRTYVDWLMDLPWNKSTEDMMDLENAEKVLNQDHYGLEKVKERILDFLAVKVLVKDKPSPILCLVGPPGVGKTSLASSIATAMNRKFVRASLGGIRDEAEIRGHRRTYVGALPGRIIQGLKKAGANNPVFLLDEIDKVGHDGYAGDPSAALLEVLDPAQNNSFSDHYLDTPFDLSKILWIVTANNLSTIPKPLRDRMEIITLSSYTEAEKYEIAKRHLVKRQKSENGLNETGDVYFGAGVFQKMISEYTREAGVRELERIIGKACRKAARKIVEGNEKPIRITKKNLKDFIGKEKFIQTKAEKKPQIGVSTGMAWTEVGGDILPTEAIVLKGKGKLILTGKLGDVMQESAQAGLTYVRSRSDMLMLEEDFYEKNDIHVHVPEGAVPKDGPSAGITMATAMISALTKRKVRSDVAMTGEITLRGNVLPIGGLKEKVLAAYREGMHTIILPKENTRDIEEIPKNIRDKLEFVPVEHMDEVLKTALIN